MDYCLEVNNLTKDLGQFSIKNISFNLPKGYIMGFIGPNGAGKTTTIKLILDVLKRDSGSIKVMGHDNTLGPRFKEDIGFVLDGNYYYEHLTLTEMKNILAPFYRNWDEATFNKYLTRFELNPKAKIKTLSTGMVSKFSLALALSHNARLLIMDEPTSGLDPVSRSEILDLLRDFIQTEERAVLFSTHITSDLEKIADYITFINKGQLVFSSTRDNILDQYKLIKGPNDALTTRATDLFIGIRQHHYGFEGLIASDNLPQLSQIGLLQETPTLEDIMLYHARGAKHV